MTKGTTGGYSTFNAPNRSWTVGKLAQRLTSNLFLDCCSVPCCYPKNNRDHVDEESSNKKILQHDDSESKINNEHETKDQMEMKCMTSNESLAKNEVLMNTDDSCLLIKRSNYRDTEELENSVLTISTVDSDDKTFTTSASLFGIKRIMNFSMLSKTGKKTVHNEWEESDDDGESSVSKIFPKCEFKESDELKSSNSELFPKCRMKNTSQQRICENSLENEASQFTRVFT